ncbi:hypothetical protein BV20DRAFT_87325 [Pilatotrama ljubarskyi]|nr:hypothetical protein BV20DRAFT_87325 [Pilatotrama ljubarskyi]
MVSSFALGVRAFGLVVDTPPRPPVQCVSFDFAWHGTASPFTFSIITGDSPEGSPVESFPGINGPSFRWDSDLPAGTTFFIKIEDATGASATTGSLVMQNGSDDSCLAKGAEPSSSSPPSTVPSPPAQLTSPSTFSPSLTHASSETGFPVAPTSPSQPDPSQATSIAESTQDQSSLGGTATQTAPIAASQIPGASTGNPEAPTGPASARVPSSPSSPTRNVSDPSTSSLTTSDSAGQTLSAGPTNAAAPPSVQQRHAGVLSIGAIVGIALGVAILLCMLLALLIWRRRRRKSPRGSSGFVPLSHALTRPSYRCGTHSELARTVQDFPVYCRSGADIKVQRRESRLVRRSNVL